MIEDIPVLILGSEDDERRSVSSRGITWWRESSRCAATDYHGSTTHSHTESPGKALSQIGEVTFRIAASLSFMEPSDGPDVG